MQAFGAFKAQRPAIVRRAGALALLLLTQSCATIFGSDKADLAVTQAIELDTIKADRDNLQLKVASLEAEKARLEAALADAAKKAQRVAAVGGEPALPPAPQLADPKIASASTLTTEKAPSKAPADPVVAAPNADTSLPPAPVPVDTQPRLVQPRLTSAEEVFENEAANPEIKMTSVLWGVHLASYRKMEEASAGWAKLQRDNPDELGLLEPRIERVSVDGKGAYLRLVGGGFSSREKAKALCDTLAAKGVFCRIANFGGERLSMLDLIDQR
ncbi:MAG: SPOR domain-containing protein [Parvularculaceae bacterium]|nr:SPOR domain-containing protein [Parvularculaceae bacterium]